MTKAIPSVACAAALCSAAFFGCGKNATETALPNPTDTAAYRAASPDDGTLTLDTSASENGASAARDADTTDAVTNPTDADTSDPTDTDPILADHPRLMLEAQNKGLVQKFNAAIAPIVAEIKTMVAGTPLPGTANSSADVHTWEATSASGKSTYRFVERKGAKGIGWLFSVKAASDADVATSYKVVLAGRIVKAPFADHRGEGIVGVDFDNQAVAGDTPLSPATGKLLMSFRHVNATDHVFIYRTDTFSPDGVAAGISAYFTAYRWHSLLLNANLLFMRAGGVEDVLPPATGQADKGDETVHIRYRRVSGVGGWATSLTFGGDVDGYSAPATGDFVRIARVCWDLNAQNQETIAYRRVWQCPLPYTPGTPDAGCTLLGNYSVSVTAGTATESTPTDDTTIFQACFPNGVGHTLLSQAAAQDLAGANSLSTDLTSSPDNETGSLGGGDSAAPAASEDPPATIPTGDAST